MINESRAHFDIKALIWYYSFTSEKISVDVQLLCIILKSNPHAFLTTTQGIKTKNRFFNLTIY